jgi:hypothetical protein
LNSLPLTATGELIENDGVWRVHEFAWQMDAILFWERFEGRWLRGTEFHYPERPENLLSLKPLENGRNSVRAICDNRRASKTMIKRLVLMLLSSRAARWLMTLLVKPVSFIRTDPYQDRGEQLEATQPGGSPCRPLQSISGRDGCE